MKSYIGGNISTKLNYDIINIDMQENSTTVPTFVESTDGGKVKGISDKQIEKIITNIIDKPSECNFTKEQSAVCSPKHIVDKMKKYADSKGLRVDNNPVKVVQAMKDLLNCNSESCILKRNDFAEFAKLTNLTDILNEFFKPEGPATNFGLLSNFNIDDVLDQLAIKFSDKKFLHIPFQMRDFEKVGTQLATTDLAQKFKEGYKCFGVVLNTDWSSGRGIHWFALFGQHYGDHIELEYFNSSGKDPLPEVQAWLQKTKHYLHKSLKIPVDIYYHNKQQFQNDDHSCGIYSILYIYCRLEGISPKWFRADNFNDQLMHKARKWAFRWEV